jgi:ABC-type Fe3+-hydroxamate transport system substrate-binding protein
MRKFLIPLLLVLALLAAACGDDSDTATSEPDAEAPTDEQEDPAGEAASTDGALVVEDNTGGEATLEAPAERVVVLEWDFAEHLLAVGVDPVGVADVAGYGDWLASELPEDVTDVGTRQEPSLEQIAALEPDLIVGVDFRHEATRDQLKAIAPTLILRDYPEPGQGSELELMREALTTIGEATGRTEQAEEALADLDEHLDEAGRASRRRA